MTVLFLGKRAQYKCLSQQYGPALMVDVPFLGFHALESSRNRALHAFSTSLSSLQAAPWNSSLFKNSLLNHVPNEVSCTLFTPLGLFS